MSYKSLDELGRKQKLARIKFILDHQLDDNSLHVRSPVNEIAENEVRHIDGREMENATSCMNENAIENANLELQDLAAHDNEDNDDNQDIDDIDDNEDNEDNDDNDDNDDNEDGDIEDNDEYNNYMFNENLAEEDEVNIIENFNEDSDNENEDNDVRNRDDDNIRNCPLYNGSQITIGESMLLIMALVLNYNLSISCVESIIVILELHCLHEGLWKNSCYKFKKYFGLNGESSLIKHYYYPSCNRELTLSSDRCPTCPRIKNSYFVELPFINQLKEMCMRPGFYDLLQLRFQRQIVPGVISDIYDGTLYQSWVRNGFLSDSNNISFTWYTDGVQVFKSTKISMWPVYLSINELPFKCRKKRQNTLLVGIWYGNKKPNMNMFLYKFQSQFKQLFDGIQVELPNNKSVHMRGVLLAGTCDLPAKCECLNFIQFNGYYGCPACLIRGQRELCNENTTNSVHVYPYDNNTVLRTSAQCVQDAGNSNPDAPVNGVRGHSILSRLMPDFIAGMGIDRMHSVDGGVVKKMLTLIFDNAYRSYPFSLYNVIHVINSRLQNINPPKYVHRMPRSVTDLLHWKTSELKMFFFYYSIPVFDGVMRIDYFQHYLRLVVAVAILSFDSITNIEIQVAKNLLHRFVQEFEQLYGLRFCSINIHLLLHLSDCVQRLGPLWVYSCYEYEDINGQFLKLIHGTGHIDTQIANSQTQFIKLIKLIEELPERKIRNFCLSSKKQVKIIEAVNLHCYSVGTYKQIQQVPNFIMNAILRHNNLINNNLKVWKYLRLLKDNKLYVSAMYMRQLKTQSSVIQYYNCNREKQIGLIHYFIKTSLCHCVQEACNCNNHHFAIVQQFISESVYVSAGSDNVFYNTHNFLHKCREINNPDSKI